MVVVVFGVLIVIWISFELVWVSLVVCNVVWR